MRVLEWIGIGVLLLLAAVAVLFVRRTLFTRAGGTIRLNVRVSTMLDGRGWSPGFARFTEQKLLWYRLFSFAIRPKRVLPREGLVIQRRRLPEGQERLSMPGDWVILLCTSYQAPVEIAMAKSALTGFQSWIEAAPPGSLTPRLAIRD